MLNKCIGIWSAFVILECFHWNIIDKSCLFDEICYEIIENIFIAPSWGKFKNYRIFHKRGSWILYQITIARDCVLISPQKVYEWRKHVDCIWSAARNISNDQINLLITRTSPTVSSTSFLVHLVDIEIRNFSCRIIRLSNVLYLKHESPVEIWW